MKNWKLKQKFTIFLLAILLIGLTLVGGALATVLKHATENEIASQAFILMETMNSVREYTNVQVKPELVDRIDEEFLPETIPAYSAREVFETLRQKNPNYRDFFYKEATINPSNLRDKADSFEKELVAKFIANNNTKELTGFRSAPSGRLFYIARPIQITQASCLECHSTPEAAPSSVIERYGSVNGMGWKLNEIVGTQTISVPAKTVFDRARQSFILIMAIISLVFIAVILLVNYLLNRNVIRPLNRMARVAEEVSTGYMDAEFEQTSNDEIGNLAEAFKRMKLSLAMAMNRLSQVNKYKREQ
ncbi:sensor protein [Stanieria sp. NIES-3757]|nr:sensor protein [Stanieria sp. NIES-3757]